MSSKKPNIVSNHSHPVVDSIQFENGSEVSVAFNVVLVVLADKKGYRIRATKDKMGNKKYTVERDTIKQIKNIMEDGNGKQ